MIDKLKRYIEDNLEIEKSSSSFFGTMFRSKETYNLEDYDYCESSSVRNFIDNNKNENKFQKLLFKYIDDRGLRDSDVYNKVHIDRRLFSKIRSDIDYHPSRETVILFGLSLKLNLDEFIDLLDSASYSLPKNNYYDLIIRFCFIEGIYDIKDVNDMLSMYGCKMFSY